jgi:hypothetical protein
MNKEKITTKIFKGIDKIIFKIPFYIRLIVGSLFLLGLFPAPAYIWITYSKQNRTLSIIAIIIYLFFALIISPLLMKRTPFFVENTTNANKKIKNNVVGKIKYIYDSVVYSIKSKINTIISKIPKVARIIILAFSFCLPMIISIVLSINDIPIFIIIISDVSLIILLIPMALLLFGKKRLEVNEKPELKNYTVDASSQYETLDSCTEIIINSNTGETEIYYDPNKL